MRERQVDWGFSKRLFSLKIFSVWVLLKQEVIEQTHVLALFLALEGVYFDKLGATEKLVYIES